MNERLRTALAAILSALLLTPPAGAALASDAVAETAAPLARVMWIVLAIWLALGAFLFKIDRDLSRLEKKIDER